MCVRVFFQTLILALALWALASPAASAQALPSPPRGQLDSRPLRLLQVVLGTQPPEPLELRYHSGRTGYVVGAFRGDRVAGYQYVDPGRPNDTTDDQHTLALVRYDSANTALQVFTADYNTEQRVWVGLVHGLAGPDASLTDNVVGFRSVPLVPMRCSRLSRVPCPSPLELPPTPEAGTAYNWNEAFIGFGINANNYFGPLLLRADPAAPGAFSGSALGDTIRGRYAPGSGTIVFLRSDASGAPSQVWYGVFEQTGARGGRGYPLGPYGGGRFDWRVTNADHAVIGLRHPSGNGRCLTEGAATDSVVIDSDCSRQWLLLAVAGSGAEQTRFSLAHVDTGLCLALSIAHNIVASQARCAGGENQRLYLNRPAGLGPSINAIADIPTSTAFRLSVRGDSDGGGCLSRMGSTGAAVTGDCGSSGANWGLEPGP